MRPSTINLHSAIERAFGIEIKSHRATARAISDLASRKLDQVQLDCVVSLVDSLGDETRILLERQKKMLKKAASSKSGIQISVSETPGSWSITCRGVDLRDDHKAITVEAFGPTLPLALDNLAKALAAMLPDEQSPEDGMVQSPEDR